MISGLGIHKVLLRRFVALIFASAVFTCTLLAQASNYAYYGSITPSTSTFVTDLHNLINPHTRITYDDFKTTNVANFASRDTTNGQKVVTCVYSGENYVYFPPFAWGHFSREHTWCQSWMPSVNAPGFTNLPEYSDQHHLFPVNQNNANGVRNNHPEGNVVTATSTYLLCKLGKDANNNTVFEPRASHKGDFARALMYMSVCYNGVSGYSWTFNYLNNVTLPALSEAAQDVSLLLQWNKDDPPDAWEVSRNTYVQSIQGNRNPFVDHPEWVNYIDFNTVTELSSPPSYSPEPSNHVTGLLATSSSSSTLDVSWTNATGTQLPSGYLIEIFNSNNYFIPIDGSTYADDTDLSDGRGVKNVTHNGTTLSYQFTGLSCGSTYYVHVYSYNGSASSINYKIDGTIPSANGTTSSSSLATEPSKYSGGFGTPAITSSAITVTWSDSSGGTLPSGYLLLANTTNNFTDPVDGVVYANDTFLSDGSAAVNSAYGSPDSYQFTGLPSATTYAFKIYPYNGDGCQRNYKTANFPFTYNNIEYTTTGSGSSSPSVVVNEYMNKSTNDSEWVELLVLEDNLDMRGMRLGDYSAGGNTQSPIVFSNNALWSSIPKGTFVVILGNGNQQIQDTDISDKKLIISDANSTYFSGSASGFDISGTADAVEILSFGGTHIHSLSHGSKPGNIAALPSPTANSSHAPSSGKVVRFINIDSVVDFGLDAKADTSSIATQGAANDARETSFISTVLPVELSSFSAHFAGKNVCLEWTTATEVNNYGFEIERKSMNNQQSTISTWTKVGFVEGHGTTNVPQSYSFSDNSTLVGKYNYRLKQIDRDGSFHYSSDVVVTLALSAEDFQLTQNFPNPFNPSTTIRFAVRNEQKASLKVYNVLGQELVTLFEGVAEPNAIHEVVFDASKSSAGVYFCVLRTPERTEARKMQLIK